MFLPFFCLLSVSAGLILKTHCSHRNRLSLAISFLTFLTTIWGEGAVFTWLLNLVGISSLMTWGSIGVISLQFRRDWKAQGRLMSDLPYKQPLYPLLPLFTIVLTVLMFAADGYASVIAEPFDVKVRVSMLF